MRYGLSTTGVTRSISKEALHIELGLKKIAFLQNLTKLANMSNRIDFHIVKFRSMVSFYLLCEN